MQMKVTIVNDRIDELKAHLSQAGLKEVQEEVAEIMNRSLERRFETDTDPDGVPWVELAPMTLAQKNGVEILEDSGRGRQESRYVVEGDRVVGILSPDYMAKHQTGEINERGFEVPQRRLLGMEAQAEAEIDLALQAYVQGLGG